MTEPKKFTLDTERWPGRYGDYCISGPTSGVDVWIWAVDHGDRTREVAEAVLDVLNGDAVVLPKLIQPEERPEPPKVEPVPMAECGGRTAEGHAAPITHLRWGGSGWVANDRDGRIWPVPADGMVSVLVEADEAAER